MKPTNGISQDFKRYEQPKDTYPFGKNGILTGNVRAIQNEHGFRLSNAQTPYHYIGVVETDSLPIIFSTDNIYSAIGFFDEVNDVYIPIIDDKDQGYKLGFNLNYPIKGEARRNYLNHIEVAFFDTLNPVRLMDTIVPPITLRGYLLFPEFGIPQINLETIDGGNVEVGANYVAVKYIKNDGTETRYVTSSTPIFTVAKEFGSFPGSSSGKSIKISLSNVDNSYDFVQVAITKKNKGIVSVVQLDKVPSAENLDLYYNGSEGTSITIEEVLIPSAFYKNVGAMTQLGDVLFLADILENEVIDMQQYANLIKLKCKSLFISDIASDDKIKSGEIKTFKHGEVIAAYIVYNLKNGQKTDAFHIPGIAPTNDSVQADSIATGQSVTAKKYQTNTVGISNIDKVNKVSSLGVWVNQEEFYPNIPNWNSSAIGGENLIGAAVRHHKLPTIQQVIEWYYTNVSEYGITGMDALGIMPENVIIPDKYKDLITGYEIYYAKRDYNNCTIPASGLTIQGTLSQRTGNDYYFTGGNWHASVLRSDFTHSDDSRMLRIQPSAYISKLHHPDLMIGKPVINPALHVNNFKLLANIGRTAVVDDSFDETNLKVDYVLQGKRLSSNYTIKGVEKAYYLANNAIRDNVKNLKSEDGYVTKYKFGGFPVNAEEKAVQARETVGDPLIPNYEEAYNVDLLIVRNNMYLGLSSQELARTNVTYKVGELPTEFSFNGDCFLVIHSYISYGLVNSLDRFPVNPGPGTDSIGDADSDTYTDEFYLGTAQGKYVRRYVTESTHNMWMRYEDPALKTSKFWPASTTEILHNMDRNKDNNSIAIAQESSSIGDMLNGIKVFSLDRPNITQSPYKVVRSEKQIKEAKFNSWKNYNPLDYYEADKNMGKIINLQGMADKLIIHHANSLYVTREIATMKTDILSVTLGSGDIFRIPPIQGRPSKSGYGGTKHKFACVLTDFGYVFPDTDIGAIYVFNEEGLYPLNNDLNNFLMKYLTTKGINPFIGNGITIGYDREFKRVLVTLKNLEFDNFVPGYEATPEFFAKLTPGVSIVLKDGRYQLYKGNNTSQYSCTVYNNPVLPDYVQTIEEFSYKGFLVGTVAATGGTPGYTYYLLGGNTNNAFVLDSLSGKLYVSNSAQLDTELQTQFVLNLKVVDSMGKSDTGTFTVNITYINLPPITQDYLLQVEENIPINTILQQIAASDPRNLSLTFSMESQNVAVATKVNSTGSLAVNDSSKFIADVNPIIDVVVRVTNTVGLYTFSHIRLFIGRVNNPPTGYNKTVTVKDTASGQIMIYDKSTDPDEAFQVLTDTVITQSVIGAFEVDVIARSVKISPGYILDPELSPYTINMRVTDSGTPALYDDFVLTVIVIYDKETLECQPYEFVCLDDIIVPEFDFITTEFEWTPGPLPQPLNIHFSMVASVNNVDIGYDGAETNSDLSKVNIERYVNSGKNYLFLNVKRIKEVFNSQEISIFGNANWETSSQIAHTAIGKIKAYKGGIMSRVNGKYINTGGVLIFDEVLMRVVKPISVNEEMLLFFIDWKNTEEVFVLSTKLE